MLLAFSHNHVTTMVNTVDAIMAPIFAPTQPTASRTLAFMFANINRLGHMAAKLMNHFSR
jgi:hypothetical protein